MKKNKFAQRFKECLKEKEISENKFAELSKLSQQSINRWTNGKNEPNLDYLLIICEVLGETPNYLLGWED